MKRTLRRIHFSPHSSLSEVNIAPVLDLVFVLWVIFTITAPLQVNNLALNLPTTHPTPAPSNQPHISTVVVGQGRIQLNNQEMTLSQFKTALAQMKADDSDAGIVVRGAGKVNYQRVVQVLDIFRQLRLTKVGLATELIEDPSK